MFKRVEKRLKRKEREDELGLDEDMKEILGLNDTDSEESESDIDSDEQGSLVGGDEDMPDIEFDDDEAEAESNEERPSDDDDQPERALITVAEAVKNPIFIISLDPDIQECIVCPGKQLKGSKMIETHKSSNAHERRLKQFKTVAATADPKANAQELIEQTMGEKQPQLSVASATSKRAEKKRTAQEKRKSKREKFKACQKAKRDALVPKLDTKSKEEAASNDSVKEGELTKKENVTMDEEDKPTRKQKKKKAHPVSPTKDNTGPESTTKASKQPVPEPPISPPKKKHKTTKSAPSDITPSTSIKQARSSKAVQPSTTKSAQKPKPTPAPVPAPVESPEAISELQAQVKDIIKSASSLAKAARARALSGDDDEGKPSKKRKKAPGIKVKP